MLTILLLHHVLVFCNSLQHVLVPVTQLVTQCHPFSFYSHFEKSSFLKEQHFSCHTIVSDLIIFLHLHTLRIACCQVERYLHKYSCYFSAQSVIYKFSRLLNSLSSELTQPAAVNAECRLWQRRECDCWIVIKHLLQLSMKWGVNFVKKNHVCVWAGV